MTETATNDHALVIPFFRGPARLDATLYDSVEDGRFAEYVRAASVPVRQNIMRIFAATFPAHVCDADLAFVEGWKGNGVPSRIESPSVFDSDATGLECHAPMPADQTVRGWMVSYEILRILRARHLVDSSVKAQTAAVSRCTEEEASGAVHLAGKGKILGITESPCPSPGRVRRAFEQTGHPARIMLPREAIDEFAKGGLDIRQEAVWEAAQLTADEVASGHRHELINGIVDVGSRVIDTLRFRSSEHEPYIVQLAHALRTDEGSAQKSLPKRLLSTLLKRPRGSLSSAIDDD